jgi:hypothetical protein
MLDYLIVFIIIIAAVKKSDLRRGYKFSVALEIIMILNFFIYAALVELMKDASVPSQRFDNLKYLFLGLAIAEFPLIMVLRKFMIRGLQKLNGSTKAIVGHLLTISVVTNALCEAIVLYGLIVFLITKNSSDFYIFLILGLISSAIYFPRYGQWEEWAKRIEAKEISAT